VDQQDENNSPSRREVIELFIVVLFLIVIIVLSVHFLFFPQTQRNIHHREQQPLASRPGRAEKTGEQSCMSTTNPIRNLVG
jgi:hypothetical protein